MDALNPENTWLHYEYTFNPTAENPTWYPSEIDVSGWTVEQTQEYMSTLRADSNARNIYTYIKGGNGSAGVGCLIPVIIGSLFVSLGVIFLLL